MQALLVTVEQVAGPFFTYLDNLAKKELEPTCHPDKIYQNLVGPLRPDLNFLGPNILSPALANIQ